MNLLLKVEFFPLRQKKNSNLKTSRLCLTMTLRSMGIVFWSHMPVLTVAQFLIDDALQILSLLSQSHAHSDTPSSSIFIRLLGRIFDFIKSLSFLQYSSQEELLSSSTDSKADNLEKAMNLLTKAANAHNPDAMYLLGELNFVHPPHVSPDFQLTIVRKLFRSKLRRSIQMVPKPRSTQRKFNCLALTRLHVRNRHR